ncbi:hypothetical protein ACEPAG_6806 [Sanghuangporus baumii]
MILTLFTAFLAVTAAARQLSSPLPIAQSRRGIDASTQCGKTNSETEGPFTISSSELEAGNATDGSQCIQVNAFNGSTISWKTNWTWTGRDSVKSFSNVNLDTAVGRQIRGITNLPTLFEWTYDIDISSIANVAYELITSTSVDGDDINEILIWLAAFNAQPISSTVDEQGNPEPVTRNINAHGSTWDLFVGLNETSNIFSFLPTNGTIQSFNSDLNVFVKFLILNNGLDQSHVLKAAQAGTEVTSGSGTLTVAEYSLDVI